MNHSLLYAKSLALLLEEVASAKDLTMVRSGLLRVRRFARSHRLVLQWSEEQLYLNDEPLPRPVPALSRLTAAMTMHGVAQINLEAGAVPRELLKLAMLLVRKRRDDTQAPTIFEEIRDAALWYVQAYPVARASGPMQGPRHVLDVGLEDLARLAARTAELQTQAAAALQAQDGAALTSVLSAITAVEKAVTNTSLRVPWTETFDAVATPEALRLLVVSLHSCGDRIGSAMAVLKRSGDAGAEILIEQLASSDSLDVRRACFDALVELRRGSDSLLELLTHEHWYVIRNAACLLGSFGSRSSEPELTHAISHDDERVRAAVVTALLQLDTPTSRATVRDAITDPAAEVRRRAVRGFLADPVATSNVETLLEALERESELDVQVEFLYALGTLATPAAVQRLIRLCSTEGKWRPPEFRIAAAEALASARLGASVPLLKAMLTDPDMHARAAARHLIRAVS
jgi:HEAT repeat protein